MVVELIRIVFKKREKRQFTVVEFIIKEPLQPEILQTLEMPDINPIKGLIISGRGPIWLYCFLTHYYHPTKFIATYDPRLGGAVIIETHNPGYRIGEIVKMEV
jgi:CRISPR-associated protein Csx3